MYGIIGEDASDVNVLKVLVRRLRQDAGVPIKVKGYAGCGEMLRKGVAQLCAFADLGCTRFIICHDADGPDPAERFHRVNQELVRPAGIAGRCCVVIPVQELEAWILADIQAVTNVFASWHPESVANPESIQSPKEHLERLSRALNLRPRYSHATHNERVAKYLDLAMVKRKCPSFRPLQEFVCPNN